LVLAARNLDRLKRVQESILRGAPDARTWAEVCDVSESTEIEALAKRHPDVDVLVNNAGAVPSGGLLEVDEQRWRTGWDTKVFAYINAARVFYQLMKARRAGVIINISGAGARMKRADYLCAGMANSAIDFFTEALGAASPGDGIRVIGISPGPVGTERYRKIAHERLEAGEPPRRYPFGRVAEPEEIGELVAFCASDRSAYVSGTVMMIDGGISVAR
jgi:NAD(P)-dependent dehydrogenase (short-subunit alcohol dehydrogenase family)